MEWGAVPETTHLSGSPTQLSLHFALWDLRNQALRRVPGAHVPMDVAALVTKGCLMEASHWGYRPDKCGWKGEARPG